MKIISWNVNGIRAVAKKGFFEFVDTYSPDILCLQEVKAFEDQYLKDVGLLFEYDYIWHNGTRPGYAGTAIFYKTDLKVNSVSNNFPELDKFDEGRITQIEFKNNGKKYILLNSYFPNGGEKVGQENVLDYKLKYYDNLANYLEKYAGENIIITGDFNICHERIDIARPDENVNSIGFLPIEREKFSEFLSKGYIDVFRKQNPGKVVYSWWSYRAGARQRNIGWRLDYFVVNEKNYENIAKVDYLNEVMGSDHCPIFLEFK